MPATTLCGLLRSVAQRKPPACFSLTTQPASNLPPAMTRPTTMESEKTQLQYKQAITVLCRYTPSKPTPEYTCFDEGEHCWDNECWKGQLCLCKNEEPRESCNNPFGPTPSPEPTTPGSGLSCW